MTWSLSHRSDPKARRIADRHYNRQKPGTPQFVPPGRCVVLYQPNALWVTSWPYAEYTKHEWAGAWVNSLFRNEGAGLSSSLIREAVAATRWYHQNTPSWGAPLPELGMITFVDAEEVESNNPGYCYECAGFKRVGYTKQQGLHAWQLTPDKMPAPEPPLGVNLGLFTQP